MTALLWAVLLAYVFAMGYWLVRKVEAFVRRNPGAFPKSRKFLTAPPPELPPNLADDEAFQMWYNGYTNTKEPENHEQCEP